MNDFLIYAARLQDAGVTSLWISLGSDKEHTRLMHVSPDSSVPHELAAKYPTRTFELDGTDRLLNHLKDDMLYSGGPTPEAVQKAINAHPLLADDLREWFADCLLYPIPTDEEVAEAGVEVDEKDVARHTAYVKGLIRGMDASREISARAVKP